MTHCLLHQFIYQEMQRILGDKKDIWTRLNCFTQKFWKYFSIIRFSQIVIREIFSYIAVGRKALYCLMPISLSVIKVRNYLTFAWCWLVVQVHTWAVRRCWTLIGWLVDTSGEISQAAHTIGRPAGCYYCWPWLIWSGLESSSTEISVNLSRRAVEL